MKKLMMIISAILLLLPETKAKPKAHIKFSATIEIGRPKKGCEGIWICVTERDWSVEIEPGAVKNNNHSIVIEENGNLFLAIEMQKVKNQDIEKYQLLESGAIRLDSEETLPREVLERLGYQGSNIFKAGTYKVSKIDNYYMVHLN